MKFSDAIFGLTKIVKNRPLARQLSEIANDLNHSSERNNVGYHARKIRSQFLGYLLIDLNWQKVDRLTPFNAAPLKPDERIRLEIAHCALVKINERCTSSILKKMPQLKQALDVYESIKPSDEIDDEAIGALVKESEIEQISNVFNETKIVQNAMSWEWPDPYQIDGQKICQAVEEIKTSILSERDNNVPDYINTILLRNNRTDEESKLLFFLLDVLSLRNSLSSANQIIYQSCVRDKITVFGEDNVIKVGANDNMLGRSFDIWSQTANGEAFLEPTDIVLVDSKISPWKETSICQITNFRLSYSREVGSNLNLRLRVIDGDLNPYPGVSNHQ